MQRVVLHCDLNNFFASAAISKNPTLKSLPVAVCGDSEKRHGIVLAKNNIAKGFGVVTAETIWEAKRKCPNLIILQPDFSLYEALSAKAQTVYYHYSDLVEPFGIDECWVELTDRFSSFEKGVQIANEIRERVKKELGITLSAGVSYNKVFAKLGSDLKKPDAVTVITPENFRDLVWPLPVRALLYVGPATERRLTQRGVTTIGGIARTEPFLLRAWLGKMGDVLQCYAAGLDRSPVMRSDDTGCIKSIGNSTTVPRDLLTEEDASIIARMLCETVASRLRKASAETTLRHISIRDTELRSFSRQSVLPRPTNLSCDLLETAMALIRANWDQSRPIRSLGVRAAGLVPAGSPVQTSLYEDPVRLQKQEAVERAVDELRRRFGHKSIGRAISLLDPSLDAFHSLENLTEHPSGFLSRQAGETG